ncbi:MAG: hypothetical protein IM473_12930 [Microcystis sp. M015S2]|uniref:hypothetical protein n=1 Tax=unclassified Microcystis TaxID=2643300 RepID=UPI0025841789|nr:MULTISPECIES: hypothetical protein [unclassified Microcystis]MCA2711202.1 hypothetical protein [Microcystis sp. M025S2]MCA2743284.1 hypothetical protein [Microcystis sp. M015S2]MCA2760643.1 hypothetical protein [Microcystis sp. M145S2]
MITKEPQAVSPERAKERVRWGNGEVGKWGNGEMGKWGNGEMGKWGNGEVGKWGISTKTPTP